jgi:hypothetical protein
MMTIEIEPRLLRPTKKNLKVLISKLIPNTIIQAIVVKIERD